MSCGLVEWLSTSLQTVGHLTNVALSSLTTQPPALHTSGHHANNGQPMFDNGRIVRWIDFCPSAKLRLGRGNYVKEEKG